MTLWQIDGRSLLKLKDGGREAHPTVLNTTLDALVNDEAHTTATAPKKRGPQKKI